MRGMTHLSVLGSVPSDDEGGSSKRKREEEEETADDKESDGKALVDTNAHGLQQCKRSPGAGAIEPSGSVSSGSVERFEDAMFREWNEKEDDEDDEKSDGEAPVDKNERMREKCRPNAPVCLKTPPVPKEWGFGEEWLLVQVVAGVPEGHHVLGSFYAVKGKRLKMYKCETCATQDIPDIS